MASCRARRREGQVSRPLAIVLLSGGLDSRVALQLALRQGRKVLALSIDYGQRHRMELAHARAQARRAGIEQLTLRLPLQGLASGALLSGPKPRQSGLKPGKPSTYVSFRNGIFLSLAFALAEARGAQEIWGGWCGDDFGGYPDCRADFFAAMQKAGRLGSWAGREGRAAKIKAPLARKSKVQVLGLALKWGLDPRQTWSCYSPKGAQPCRLCDACRLRARAFHQLKVKP